MVFLPREVHIVTTMAHGCQGQATQPSDRLLSTVSGAAIWKTNRPLRGRKRQLVKLPRSGPERYRSGGSCSPKWDIRCPASHSVIPVHPVNGGLHYRVGL